MAEEQELAADDQDKKYSIAALLALTPEQQLETFGLNDKLEEIREYLGEMAKLEGKAKDEAERIVADMFSPDIDVHRMKWALEDAKLAGKQTGKQALCDCSPTSVLD